MDEIMTLADLSGYLKLSEKTVQKMIKNKEIPCTKIANQWRFSRTMIDDWLRSQMEVIPKNDLSRLIEREYDYIPLARLIDEDSMIMNLASSDKEGVLRELAQVAYKNKLISSPDELMGKLIEREELASTTIGDGVALPHLRKPSKEIIYEPKIVIGLSKDGVDFGSRDGHLTHLFFLILSDSEVVHVRILSRIARILRQKEALEMIRQFSQKKEFIQFFLEQDNMRLYGRNR